jgi:5'-nucleotidase
MGRETKLMLGLLATLAGVFLGVLSMKLLVPRPPAGAGPDVHADVVATEPHALVDPPALDEPEPLEPAAAPAVAIAAPAERLAPPPLPSRFAPAAIRAADAPPTPMRDPFVTTASLEQPDEPAAAPPAERFTEPHNRGPVTPANTYVAKPGDSWWSLAERAYGDGRLYRALFAWNRAIDPRVSLVPGTPLEIPPPERLHAAWPALLPAE